ncbi:MAG: hypothetical protein FWF37_00305 [Chloroflexi bacterium]|nr:hypothetical protein [Chloroflexota bacterium]
MRRGCVSLGDIVCDCCRQAIPYPERYLAVDVDENGQEIDNSKTVRYCAACALKKNLARYRDEKGEKILTFFTD